MQRLFALDGRFYVAFLSLSLVLHEIHELFHTWTGRGICGAFGIRDFNSWQLAPGCETPVPTMMGPLFSYLVIYAGVLLLRSGSVPRRHVALAMIFGCNVFGRLFTAIMGGGDEMVLVRHFAGTNEKTPMLRLIDLAIVSALCLPAMIAAWRAMERTSRRAAWYIALMLGPIFATGILYLLIMNRLLHRGVLATPEFLGEPLLLVLNTVIALVLFMATSRWLPAGGYRGFGVTPRRFDR